MRAIVPSAGRDDRALTSVARNPSWGSSAATEARRVVVISLAVT